MHPVLVWPGQCSPLYTFHTPSICPAGSMSGQFPLQSLLFHIKFQTQCLRKTQRTCLRKDATALEKI